MSTFTYASICSGIEAASVAWEPLGWKPVLFSEIEKFPISVLKHRYPDVPVHGDFTTLIDSPPLCDLLCGGTPCQAFSVAGLRESLADDRGNLTLQFVKLANAIDALRLAAGKQPAWILWENVPGVLSTKDNAFGAFLGGLCGRDAAIPEPAEGWARAGVVDGPTRCCAWRVLDAQHFGLAQRRQRVFVLARGGAGKWAAADALLPIIESSSWNPAPSKSPGEGVAPTVAASTPSRRNGGSDPTAGHFVARTLRAKHNISHRDDSDTYVAHTLRGEGFDASEDGTGRGIPLVMAHGQANAEIVKDGEPSLTCIHEPPILVRMREGCEGGGKGPLVSKDQSLTLATANDQILAFQGNASHTNSMNPSEVSPTLDKSKANGLAVAYTLHGTPATKAATETDVHASLRARTPGGSENSTTTAVMAGMQVRRLTPVECMRLQGFPDTHCHIPTQRWRKVPADEAAYLASHGLATELRGEQWFTNVPADGPIYKAGGNSWATLVARYVGTRIEHVRQQYPTT